MAKKQGTSVASWLLLAASLVVAVIWVDYMVLGVRPTLDQLRDLGLALPPLTEFVASVYLFVSNPANLVYLIPLGVLVVVALVSKEFLASVGRRLLVNVVVLVLVVAALALALYAMHIPLGSAVERVIPAVPVP